MSRQIALNGFGGYNPARNRAERACVALQGVRKASKSAVKTGFFGPTPGLPRTFAANHLPEGGRG